MNDLRKLAESARAKVDGPIDFKAIIDHAIKEQHAIMLFANTVYDIDYQGIWDRYAREIGKPELSKHEKRVALINAILESGD